MDKRNGVISSYQHQFFVYNIDGVHILKRSSKKGACTPKRVQYKSVQYCGKDELTKRLKECNLIVGVNQWEYYESSH